MLQCPVVDVDAQHASGVGSIAFMRFDAFGLESKGLEQVNKLTTAGANVEALFRFEGYEVDDVKITQEGAASANGGRVQGSLSGTATNGGVTSGAKTYTGGIRWILNPNVVVKGNYSYTKFDNAFAPIDVTGATAVVKDEKLLMFRTQFMF